MSSARSTIRPALLALCALALGASSCDRRPAGPVQSGDRVQLEIQGRKIRVEVASDPSLRQRGLMHRESLGEDEGMLFIFTQRQTLQFWMRNTPLPLSIAFLADQGTILQIESMRPKDESHTVSKYLVRHALEMKQGWFDRNGVKVGDRFDRFAEAAGQFEAR